jgi:PKD repeat protein
MDMRKFNKILISVLFIIVSVSGYSKTQMISPPPQCNAYFNYYFDWQNNHLVHFLDSSSGNIGYRLWLFGDGDSSNLVNPTHLYQAAGTYSVKLIVGDSAMTCVDSMSVNVVIQPYPCYAYFNYYPDTSSNLMIHFVDSVSPGINSFLWTFGDGDSSNLQSPVHSYAAAGQYTVTLLAWSTNGNCSDTATTNITVFPNPSPCNADFSFAVDTVNSQKIIFTDMSSGNINAWLWYFGDGDSSIVKNPVHTYQSAGSYTVQLSVYASNCLDTISKTVTVTQNINGNLLVYAYDDSLIYDSATVYLYKYLGSNTLIPKDSVTASGQNPKYYYFSNIPAGYYRVFTKVNSVSPLIDTWYPSEYYWKNADSVQVVANTTKTAVVQIVKPNVTYPEGDGYIYGNVSKPMSIPVDGVEILLMLNDSDIIAKTKTNIYGNFDFNNLGFGTYLVHPELKGYNSNGKKVTLNYSLDSVYLPFVMLANDIVISGFFTALPVKDLIKVYPNPATDIININTGRIKADMKVKISVIDVGGRIMYSENCRGAEFSKKIIDIKNYPKGLYFIVVDMDGFKLRNKFIKL